MYLIYMNSIKHIIMENMTNEQRTLLLLKIPYINLFKLQKIYKKNINLIDGSSVWLQTGSASNPKEKIDYDKEYNKEYDNNTGKFNIEIDKNKYYYRVERYSTCSPSKDGNLAMRGEGTKHEDKEYKFIDFITIKDKYKGLVDCGSISIDIKNKTATITSLGNGPFSKFIKNFDGLQKKNIVFFLGSPKCLKSKNNVEFKYGDILYQIMLYICKKEKLKKIELTDNSNRKCGDIDLSLDYLKTLTHGFPHYHKYGFKFKYDEDNETLKENYNNYQNDPKITKNKLLSLLKKKKVDEKTIESINKVLDKLPNNEISIKKFVKLYTLDLINKENCDLIHKIYIELYKEAGYKFYSTKDYVLNLK